MNDKQFDQLGKFTNKSFETSFVSICQPVVKQFLIPTINKSYLRYKSIIYLIFLFLTLISCSVFRSNNIDYAEHSFQIERLPGYRGGDKALQHYLKKNLKYPENALKNNIQGIVKVAFTINKYGQLSDIEIISSVNYEIDKEAIRLILEMPDWLPAIENGEPIEARIILPLNFHFE